LIISAKNSKLYAPRGMSRCELSPIGLPVRAPRGRARARTGAHANYYVNLEQPHRRDGRDGRATISSDHVLDIVVQPDRTYHRKDEDELAEAVRQGRYTAAKAAAIELDADEVEAVIDAWGSPFCDGWESWQPDPAWPIPPLPDDIAFQVDLIE